ncbi:MAG: hypothetical protein HY909_25865 [Deltaproteobacteria bacterium]|nr:hypothetical protein [Deltaproteobacteria bacterium]
MSRWFLVVCLSLSMPACMCGSRDPCEDDEGRDGDRRGLSERWGGHHRGAPPGCEVPVAPEAPATPGTPVTPERPSTPSPTPTPASDAGTARDAGGVGDASPSRDGGAAPSTDGAGGRECVRDTDCAARGADYLCEAGRCVPLDTCDGGAHAP